MAVSVERAATRKVRLLRATAWLGLAVLGATFVRVDVALAAAPGAPRCTIVGTPGADLLIGTPGPDVICGRGGDDRIDGRGGDDRIRGGRGDDTIRGGGGDDRITGGPGDDLVLGGAGDDLVLGRGGDDLLKGGPGADRLYAGRGDDELRGGSGRDLLHALDGAPFRDRIACGTGIDRVRADRRDVILGDCAETSPDPLPTFEPPVAVNDVEATDEDTPLVLPTAGAGSPAANDTDADGDSLTVTAVGGPTGGAVVLAAGEITFTPAADLCGDAAGGFTYTVSDGSGLTALGSVVVDIACVDDAAVAVDDSFLLDEDDGLTGLDVLANDTDVDGGPLEVTAVTAGPANGFATVQAGGTGIDYTPDADYCNVPPGVTPDRLTYEITGGSTATVSISVTCIEDGATAVDDSVTLDEDSAATPVDVLANDVAGQSEALSVSQVTTPAHGVTVITGGGTGLTYQPDADYCGSDTFDYQLSGGGTATVSVTVTCVNDLPTLSYTAFLGGNGAVGNTTLVVDDPTDAAPAVSTPAKTVTGDLLASASDVDGDTLEFEAATLDTLEGGTVELQADGDFTYFPPAGCPASDAFTATVLDGHGGIGSGTVGLALSNCVWYVDNTATAGGDGTSDTPFDTLAEAEAASTTNAFIRVAGGDGTDTGYDTGIDLQVSQTLSGEAVDLTIDGLVLPAAPSSRPLITNDGADVVTLTGSGGVSGVRIDPSGPGSALVATSGGAVISDVQVIDTGSAGTAPAVDLSAPIVQIATLTVDNSDATGATSGSIGLRVSGTQSLNMSSGNSVTTQGARALDISNVIDAFIAAESVTVTGSSTGAVRIVDATGPAFLGKVDLSTNGGTALDVQSVGSLSVIDATSQIAAVGGTALDVRNTAISAFDLNFQSISASGGTNGIVLSGTGTGGGLVVTGSGGTCTDADTTGCSGGTIANLTGADDSSATPAGTGIVLNDTQAPSFTRMWLNGASNYGIRGTSVRGLTLATSVVGGNLGDSVAAPYYDSAIAIDELTGSATISGSHISGGMYDNLRVDNTAGSLDRLTVSGTTVAASGSRPANDAVRLESTGSIFNATITGSAFESAAGDLLQVVADASSNDLVVQNSSFRNTHPAIAGGGVTVSQGAGAMTALVDSNTFRDAVGHAVVLAKLATATSQSGTFSNNLVGVAGEVDSGSTQGSGVLLDTLGGGGQVWRIAANQIRGYNEYGLSVRSTGAGAGGNQDTTVTGNTVAEPGLNAIDGIHYNVGTNPADTHTVCAAITGNTVAGSAGVAADDIRLRQRQGTTVRLPGYVGGPTDTAAVAAFVLGLNPGASVSAVATVPPGAGFVGGAPCILP